MSDLIEHLKLVETACDETGQKAGSEALNKAIKEIDRLQSELKNVKKERTKLAMRIVSLNMERDERQAELDNEKAKNISLQGVIFDLQPEIEVKDN
jgi:peptidoglycan hydrolase CwlO-like protein